MAISKSNPKLESYNSAKLFLKLLQILKGNTKRVQIEHTLVSPLNVRDLVQLSTSLILVSLSDLLANVKISLIKNNHSQNSVAQTDSKSALSSLIRNTPRISKLTSQAGTQALQNTLLLPEALKR